MDICDIICSSSLFDYIVARQSKARQSTELEWTKDPVADPEILNGENNVSALSMWTAGYK